VCGVWVCVCGLCGVCACGCVCRVCVSVCVCGGGVPVHAIYFMRFHFTCRLLLATEFKNNHQTTRSSTPE